MNMNDKLHEIGIVPVVVIDDVKDAAPLAAALVKGGLPAAEVTFRTACAKDAIAAMAKAEPELLVGAGTILSVEMAQEAVEAGAKFIVSPGFDADIVKWCQEKNIPVLPGCATATDVQAAYKMGLRTVKFFPAEPAGGLNMIKAIAAPYHMMNFMPTGGISEKNMDDYLKYDKILCIGGSWMVKKDLIEKGEFEKIEHLCKEAVKKMKEVRG